MSILDFIFPKYCVNCKKLGSYICSDCFSTISFNSFEKCLVCNRPSIDGLTHPFCNTRYSIDGAFTSISYKGIVKKLVYQFKYKPFVSDLCNTMVELLYEGLIQKEQFIKTIESREVLRSGILLRETRSGFARQSANNFILVPIPLYKSKLRSRGYNQAKILALGLSKKLNIPMIDVLARIKDTSSQVGLDREKRKENISNAFSVASHILISQYPYIFIVDDILTTGSTLLEAANVLKRKGAKKVWGIALARD